MTADGAMTDGMASSAMIPGIGITKWRATTTTPTVRLRRVTIRTHASADKDMAMNAVDAEDGEVTKADITIDRARPTVSNTSIIETMTALIGI